MCMYGYIDAFMHVYMYVCMDGRSSLYLYKSITPPIGMHVHVCTQVNVHTHTHTHTDNHITDAAHGKYTRAFHVFKRDRDRSLSLFHTHLHTCTHTRNLSLSLSHTHHITDAAHGDCNHFLRIQRGQQYVLFSLSLSHTHTQTHTHTHPLSHTQAPQHRRGAWQTYALFTFLKRT